MERTNPVAALPIPSSYLVLHKLKQWDDSWAHALNNPNSPNNQIAADSIRKELINMLKNLRYTVPPFNHDPNYDRKLHNESAPRVDRFLAKHNMYGKEWRQMGFSTTLTRIKTNNTPIRAVPEGSVRPSEGPARPPRETPIRPRNLKKGLNPMQIRLLAAQTTVAILTELGLPCAIFGSMACKLYGNQRVPNDVDILVLPPPELASITQEEIKALIAQHPLPNYHFVLKPARDPKATYKVLHFVVKPRPSPTPASITRDLATLDLQDPDDPANDDDDDDDNISHGFTIPIRVPPRFSSKVDILLPGVMHLPALPISKIAHVSSLPLVPFPVLLLQKLQAWSDHRAATEARYRAKIGEDARDLEWCLNVHLHFVKYAINKNGFKEMWSDRTMFSEEFEALSRERVRDFCQVYTGLREVWKAIGFDV